MRFWIVSNEDTREQALICQSSINASVLALHNVQGYNEGNGSAWWTLINGLEEMNALIERKNVTREYFESILDTHDKQHGRD